MWSMPILWVHKYRMGKVPSAMCVCVCVAVLTKWESVRVRFIYSFSKAGIYIKTIIQHQTRYNNNNKNKKIK